MTAPGASQVRPPAIRCFAMQRPCRTAERLRGSCRNPLHHRQMRSGRRRKSGQLLAAAATRQPAVAADGARADRQFVRLRVTGATICVRSRVGVGAREILTPPYDPSRVSFRVEFLIPVRTSVSCPDRTDTLTGVLVVLTLCPTDDSVHAAVLPQKNLAGGTNLATVSVRLHEDIVHLG